MKRSIFLLWVSSVFGLGTLQAQDPVPVDTTGVKVYFQVGASSLNPVYRDNGEHLESFARRVAALREIPGNRLRIVRISTSSSPDGNAASNQRLSERRAASIVDYVRHTISLPDSLVEVLSFGEDWEDLIRLVEESSMPYREEALDILRNTPVWVVRNGVVVDGRKRQLQALHGGQVWRYMYEHMFPELRNSRVYVVSERYRKPEPKPEPVPEPEPEPVVVPEPVDTLPVAPVTPPVVEPEPVDTLPAAPIEVPTVAPVQESGKPFYMALKSNLLYDVALVPNIGIEFYVGRGWSLGGSWMYAWWKSERRHNFWRTYGGEFEVRKYLGQRAKEKPLTGHHLGLYGQMLTYDFETGSTGYLSKMSYGAGIEYGYSLPIGRRLNLDFGIGIGYLGGEYKVYDPMDTHYVWKQTKQRHWFGPTKAEISLVWLIGRGNYNAK